MSIQNNRGDVSKLTSDTELNYQKAITFYEMKKTWFLKKLEISEQKKHKETAEVIENVIMKDLQNRWNNFLSDNIIELGQGKISVKQNIIKDAKVLGFSGDEQYYTKLMTKPTMQKTELGYLYEEFTAHYFQNIKEKASGKLNNYSNLKINELFSLFETFEQTGAISRNQIEGSRMANTSILLDVATSIKTKLNEKNGKLETVKGMSPELEGYFNLEEISYSKDKTEIEENFLRSTLNSYLNAEGDIRGFGFSLKNYDINGSGGGNKYTSSVLQKKMINNIFRITDPHSWNANYAQAQAEYILSTQLIGLLGPTTLGVMEKHQYLWMSQFISDFYLTMHVYFRKLAPKNEGVYPHIQSGNIYLIAAQARIGKKRNYIIDKNKQTMIDSKTKKEETYYKMSYQIN